MRCAKCLLPASLSITRTWAAKSAAIVEEEFRRPESGLRVIVATTTLAMGVNTPASSVVIAGLMHPGDSPYSVAEYKNLVGRAAASASPNAARPTSSP